MPTLLPLHPQVDPRPAPALPIFHNVSEAIKAYEGDDSIHLLYPERIAAAARTFLDGFPGQILYAVKANPHPEVLKTLWHEGVHRFDVASLREIDLVQSILPNATLYLMHPVKSRTTIREAYARGVRHFSFDHTDELNKILTVLPHARDLHLHLRLAVNTDTKMSLSGKFGADQDTAIDLLKAARPQVPHLGLCFHVGSQCLDPDQYDAALRQARTIVDAACVKIDSLDLGGGFPVAYPDMPIPPMAEYFSTIHSALKTYNFNDLTIMGEPGRALCAEGGSTLARVELRKGCDLYLNDGTYGSLFDAGQFAWKYPVRLHRSDPPQPGANTIGFRFFGPTCDSADKMTGPFHLPADTREGDWIEIEHLGAYGKALTTQFNGFYSDHTVIILDQ